MCWLKRCCCELFVALALALFASASGATQTVDSNAATTVQRSSVSGTVVNAITGEPVPHALVMMFINVQHATFTDSNGQFTIGDLPEHSTATLQVAKPGYFSSAENGGSQATVTIRGANSATLRIALMPDAVISGHVMDEERKGLPGAMVVAKCARIIDGLKHWDQCGSTATDEEGSFRFPHLMPGSYYLRVIGTNFHMREDGFLQPTGYEPAFYPAQRTGVRTTFELLPASRKEINVTLHSARLYNVYGAVDVLAHNQMVSLELLSSDGEQMPAEQQIDPGGTFVLKNVPAGQYRLRATADPRVYHGVPASARRPGSVERLLTAETPITVASDIAGVTLALRPMAVIPVNVRAELTHDPAENRVGVTQVGNVKIRPGTPVVQVCAHALDGRDVSVCSTLETQDDIPVFKLRGVPPGRYNVELMPMGMFYASSMTYNGADLLNEPLEVKPGADATPIDVTVRDDVASLGCSLRTGDHNTHATVLIVSDNGHWTRALPTSGQGEARIESMPPGDYKVYAFEDVSRLEYRNPEVLSEYSTKAVPITLQPNENHSLKLDVISGGAR